MEEIVLTEADLEEVQGSEWGEDGELVERWFKAGEELATNDWIYWLGLYDEGANRSDLLVHWLRCLLDPTLPRPAVPRVIEAEPPPTPHRLELALDAR